MCSNTRVQQCWQVFPQLRSTYKLGHAHGITSYVANDSVFFGWFHLCCLFLNSAINKIQSGLQILAACSRFLVSHAVALALGFISD